ncbi:MAG: response regulator [Candidatus Aenigmarchaeota archaeon]|nr:response regulator [Candidatus Aenigmarchaeota archaeon]
MDSKKILVIEDDTFLVQVYSDQLIKNGYQVEVAASGEEGLKKIETNPNAILLDLILPGMSGLDVLGALRKDPKTKKTPIIVLTVVEDKKEIKKALELGADDYLLKSKFSLNEVVGKIERILGSS